MPEIDTGNTAWLLVSSALVLLMTPGLALFYGGLNRSKGVLNMMMMSFATIGLVSVLWLFYGFSMSFGSDTAGGLFGNLGDYFGGKTFLAETDLWGATADNPNGIGIPALCVHGVPDDVRDHHRRADQRRGFRPHEVRRLAALRVRLGDAGVLPGGAQHLGRRLDRQTCTRSTSPAVPRCTSTPVRPRSV